MPRRRRVALYDVRIGVDVFWIGDDGWAALSHILCGKPPKPAALSDRFREEVLWAPNEIRVTKQRLEIGAKRAELIGRGKHEKGALTRLEQGLSQAATAWAELAASGVMHRLLVDVACEHEWQQHDGVVEIQRQALDRMVEKVRAEIRRPPDKITELNDPLGRFVVKLYKAFENEGLPVTVYSDVYDKTRKTPLSEFQKFVL